MFVANNELKNAIQLTKIKLYNTKKSLIYSLLFVLFIILSNLIPTLFYIFKQADGIMDYIIQDYSIPFAIGFLIGIVVVTCGDKTNNQLYSVFPQTNTSRFLSSQALYYIYILCFAILSLFMYLIQYTIFAVIARLYKNMVLVYQFHWSFVLAGFFVLIVYLAIITAIITLIATLIRKFRIYGILSFAFLGVLILTNMVKTIEFSKRALGFLIFEKNPALFVLKGIIIWAVLFFISLIINKLTIYYKSNIKISRAVIAGIVVVGVLAIGVAPLLLFDNMTISSTTHATEQNIPNINEILIDTSEIPPGSEINIVTTENIVDDTNQSEIFYGDNIDRMHLSYDENALSSFSGQKILIHYDFPSYMRDDYELTRFSNPKFSAHLNGNTIYLDYSYDKNIKAIFIPVWSFMWQFDGYKGKDIFKEFAGSSSGGGEGYVLINVE